MSDLPKCWAWKPLREICITKGQYGSGAKKVDFDGKVRYVRITDIDDSGSLKSDDVVSPSAIEDDCFLEKDDLLFARSGSVGRTYLHQKNDIKYQFAGYLIRFKINQSIAVPKYIYYVTKSKQYLNWIESIKKSGTLSNINAKEFASFEIPVPPLPVQKRIVAILERAEKLKEMRERANKDTNAIIQSLFYEMFGDPIINEKGFEVVSGNQLFILSSGKFNPTKNLDDSYNYPTYGGNGITGRSKDYLIDFDTIVIGRVGAYCGSVYKTSGKIWVTDNAIYLKEFLKKINLDYLLYFFKTQNLNKFAAQSGQPKITQKPLENMKIPFPPISLQNRFAALVEKIEALKRKQSDSTSEINNLFDALMQKAFNGELGS